jgi:hypothetical protein
MSTLVAQTISNGTVSTSSANVIQGSAKAWVNFNGTGTVAIRDSYNVSSITDNGTGNYTINFTNAMPDANYCAVGQNEIGTSTGTKGFTYSTSNLVVVSYLYNAVAYDCVYNSVAIFS